MRTTMDEEEVVRESRRRTRRSFLVAAAAAAGGYGFYRWLDRSPMEARLQRPLRKMLNFNAALARGVFDDAGLAPTYAVGRSVDLRVNGVYGLKRELIPESYRLQMVGVEKAERFSQYVSDVTAWEYRYTDKNQPGAEANHDTKVAPKMDTALKMAPKDMQASAEYQASLDRRMPRGQEEAGESRNTLKPETPGLLLKMEDLEQLPPRELVTEFKCIEGWSEIVHWGGVRLADVIAMYPPAPRADGSLPRYVYMETPNGDYYCGFDMHACQHPQSLLVTHMAGQPLTQWHGAPLRLHMPIKYGYKQIKRIGLIAYTDSQPDDYWTKLGYDWYAGL